jgi:Holliday junction resolvase RusA-like endonuclease
MTYTVPGVPVPKPRMTQQDRWLKRERVLKYWDWKARVQKVCPVFDPRCDSLSATFYLPRPKALKQRVTVGHHGKPDLDNLLKGLLDALTTQDETISYILVAKHYDDGQGPRVEFSIW